MYSERYKIAGIVLFNPDISRLKENVEAVLGQVEKLIIVDNGSKNIDLVESLYSSSDKIIFVKNGSNLGIAKALNIVVKAAQSLKYDWVLLLDQDSVIPLDLIDKYSNYINIKKAAIICPIINDRNDIRDTLSIEPQAEYTIVKECITSGSLVNCSICEEMNYFNDEMFIDYVDLDYSKRLSLAGYSIIQVNNVKLLHEVGKKTYHKLLFFTLTTFNHSAFRKYYITRNTLYYARKYKDESVLKAYLKILKRFLIVLLFETDKTEKMISILKGIKDSRHLK